MATFDSPSSSSLDNHMISASSSSLSSSSSSGAAIDDSFEDACSICLEPFTTEDPATVTSCKHEYHLQCILDWSQRSEECPICWRLLVLKDPASQELVAAVEIERHLRSRHMSPATSTNIPHFHEDFDVEQDSYSDDSDFDDHIMQHLSAASGRAHYLHRRERQRSSGFGLSRVLAFPSPANVPSDQQTNISPDEGQSLSYGSSGVHSPTPGLPSVANSQHLPSIVPPGMNEHSNSAVIIDGPFKSRQAPTDTPQGQGSSEMLSFSDSIKSKWFSASARYKESFSKSTKGLKETLLARNNSVKEITKGVQREMSAGIAGVARMIERLDLAPKRTGAFIPNSGFTGGMPNFFKGKGLQENVIARTCDKNSEDIACGASLDTSSHISRTVPSELEVPYVQRDH